MEELSVEKQKDFKKLQDWLKKVLPEDYDKFDLKAEFDSSLSYMENKNLIREKLKGMVKDLKEQMLETKAEQEKIIYQEKAKAEEEVQEYNKKVTYEVNQEVDKYYQPIRRAVDKVCKGYSHLLFCKGRPGTGKSWNIRRVLTENDNNFVEVAGEVTEAYLYRLLYENNGKVIWLKDISNLLSGLKSIQILKAATETEEARVITKSNYSKQQDDLPDRFVCKCKFIFDYNNIQNTLRDDFEALISRGDFIEFTLSPKEMEHIMRQIARNPEEKEITEFIISNFTGSGLVRLNLRTQWKAINTYKYATALGLDWKQEIDSELKRVSKIRALLYGLIGNEAVRRGELKKLLIKHEIVNSIRMADYKIKEWIFIDELFDWSNANENNGFVSLVQKEKEV
jgi:Skp family chaperone for outer membrane proteins